MAEETSTFRAVIEFLDKLGIYDVVLPFLLVFTVVFAVLEKSRVFGTEEVDGKPWPKKNLNAMTAFVIAFLVVLSSRLVATINQAMANVVILLMVSISFLVLIGSFYREGEDVFLKEGAWRTTFMILMALAVALIFLWAIPASNGQPWLEWFWTNWLTARWGTGWLGSIILVIVVIIFMAFIVKGPSKPKAKKEES
ncbi:MAG: hypothetical protein ABH879_10710 [archaeon]